MGEGNPVISQLLTFEVNDSVVLRKHRKKRIAIQIAVS
jgi:hypothetical protein